MSIRSPMNTNAGFEFRNGKEFAEHVLEALSKISASRRARFTVMFSFCYDSEEFVRDYAAALETINWEAKVTHDAEAPKPWVIRISRPMAADKRVLRQIGDIAALSQEEKRGVFEMWGAVCISSDEEGTTQRGLLSRLFGGA